MPRGRHDVYHTDPHRFDGGEDLGLIFAATRIMVARAMTSYLVAKAVHIIGFVTWFAGLFYIVRLFVYWVEATARAPAQREILEPQLALMTRRLWYIITWPSLVVTVVFGTWLLTLYGNFAAGWVHAKLGLVVLLIAYHLVCQHIYNQLRRGICRWRSIHLRMWNEVATLLLVAIVFVAVFKTMLSAAWGVGGLVALAVVLMIAIRAYGRVRARASAQLG